MESPGWRPGSQLPRFHFAHSHALLQIRTDPRARFARACVATPVRVAKVLRWQGDKRVKTRVGAFIWVPRGPRTQQALTNCLHCPVTVIPVVGLAVPCKIVWRVGGVRGISTWTGLMRRRLRRKTGCRHGGCRVQGEQFAAAKLAVVLQGGTGVWLHVRSRHLGRT